MRYRKSPFNGGIGYEVVLLGRVVRLPTACRRSESERTDKGVRAIAAVPRCRASHLGGRCAQEAAITDDLDHGQDAALCKGDAAADLTAVLRDARDRKHVVDAIVHAAGHDQDKWVRSPHRAVERVRAGESHTAQVDRGVRRPRSDDIRTAD